MQKNLNRFVSLLVILFLISSLSILGCKVGKKEVYNKPNIILITVDSLRADHLSCYGYQRNTTPNIDKLANNSTLFKKHMTVYPKTTPSAVSMMTGLYPHSHGTR